MSRSSSTWAPPCDLPRTPDVHPAVRELVAHPVIVPADGVDLLRANQRPRTTHVIVFDTETTGIGPSARIVEVAAGRVRLSDGVVEMMWSKLVNPGCPIPREATAVHHITDAMVREAPGAAQVLPLFLASAARSGLVLVAHNADFDVALVTQDAHRCDLSLPKTIPVHCSLEASRRLHVARGHKLELVAQRYGIPTPDSHRAEGDVRTLAAVLPHLLKRPDAASRDFRDVFPLKAML